jgi:hypothetical protein
MSPLLVAILVFFVYFWTMNPTVAGGDSGELMCVAHTLGVAHPPGYPLFILITKLGEVIFQLLFTGMTVGFAQNLTQVVVSVGAAVVLYDGISILVQCRASAVLGTSIFSFSSLVWSYAVQTEVFALNNFLCAALLNLAIRYQRQMMTEKALLLSTLAALVSGLALANQHSSVVFVVPLVLWCFIASPSQFRRPSNLIRVSMAFFLGLSVYLFLPISATYYPSMNSWGSVNEVRGFLTHLLRREYGTFSLASQEADYRKADFWFMSKLYLQDTAKQTNGIGTLLAAIGVITGLTSKELVPRKICRLFFALWVGYCTFFNSLSNLPVEQPLFFGVQQRFWMQPLLLVSIFAAVGFSRVASRLSPRSRFAITAVLISLHIARSFDHSNESNNVYIRDFGRTLLAGLPNGSLLLTKGDLMLNSARYVQCVDGFRSDVVILDQELLTYEWYNKRLAQLHPEIPLRGIAYHPYRPNHYDIRTFLEDNAKLRRVFLAVGWKEGDHSHQGAWDLLPFGLSEEAIPKATKLDFLTNPQKKLQRIAELKLVLPTTQKLPPLNRYHPSSWEAVVLGDTRNALSQTGYYLLTLCETGIGLKKQIQCLNISRDMFSRALNEFGKTPSDVSRNLGVVFQTLLKHDPYDLELLRGAHSAFSRHLTDLRSEGVLESDSQFRVIKDAVSYYEKLLRETGTR